MADGPNDHTGAPARRPALRPFSGQAPKAGEGTLRPLGSRRPAVAPFAAGLPGAERREQRRFTPPAVAIAPGVAAEAVNDEPPSTASAAVADSAADHTSAVLAPASVGWEASPAGPPQEDVFADASEPTDAGEPGASAPEWTPEASAVSPQSTDLTGRAPVPEVALTVVDPEGEPLGPAGEAPIAEMAFGSVGAAPAESAVEPITVRTRELESEAVAEGEVDAAAVVPVADAGVSAPMSEALDDVWPHDLAEDVEGLEGRASAWLTRADQFVEDHAVANDAGKEDSARPVVVEDRETESWPSRTTSESVAEGAALRALTTWESEPEVPQDAASSPTSPQLLDDELAALQLSAEERPVAPTPIPGIEALDSVEMPDSGEPFVSVEAPQSIDAHELAEGRASSPGQAWTPVAGVERADSPDPDEHASGDRPSVDDVIDVIDVAVAADLGTRRDASSAVPPGEADSSRAGSPSEAPGAEVLAFGDASLADFMARERVRAHVVQTLEAVARRVRVGEIVPATSPSALPEAVLASVLASLLSPPS